jgi:DnaJ-class molecular chaperone
LSTFDLNFYAKKAGETPLNQQPDYYNVLQVHHDAEKDVIDAAYKCLSKMYHPDLNRTPAAAERMKEINIAYQVVGSEALR